MQLYYMKYCPLATYAVGRRHGHPLVTLLRKVLPTTRRTSLLGRHRLRLPAAWGDTVRGTRYARQTRGWYVYGGTYSSGRPGQAAPGLWYVQHPGGWYA